MILPPPDPALMGEPEPSMIREAIDAVLFLWVLLIGMGVPFVVIGVVLAALS